MFSIMIALVLFTAVLMIMPVALEYSNHTTNAFSKKSSTNCEGDVCHTSICTNNNCHTLISNLTQQLDSMVQTKMHGSLSNSIQELLNSTNA
jgi:hypothetical protein